MQARRQQPAMAAAARRRAPRGEALGFERLRILFGRRHRRRRAGRKPHQLRKLGTQALASTERAGAREQDTIERGLEFGIDHLLVQQARLVDRLRHRHEDSHPVRHDHVDRRQ